MIKSACWMVMILALMIGGAGAEEPLKVGVFAVDASPQVGSPLAYNPTKGVTDRLSCRGVVLTGAGQPIVLCAVDWLAIANDGQAEFRKGLAAAAGTVPERVAVHVLHQHDAPRCDLSTDRLLAKEGINREFFDADFVRDVIARAATAVKLATTNARTISHLGLGQAEVEMVASNRRILGPDGKVEHVRYTACKDPAIRAKPVGTIDPVLKVISFWDGAEPVAALTYYATHPQSYYLTGLANPDFPGMARDQRQKATQVPHVHFNGAGGNIGAGKWNDGAHENRQILADRVAAGMAKAWSATVKKPVTAADVIWESIPVALPPAAHLEEAPLQAALNDASKPALERADAARKLIWLRRCQAGERIDVACLHLGTARILHLPGELFVEYQLAAQKLRPDLFVAMAAYGDGAPGYIGTEIAYSEGGYETSPKASLVAPNVEKALMDVIERLLKK
ncbi:hypothetical protein V5E97_33555 [Singulisphaera sp. Ch08]|uniref:Neutral/alkaline non-lysosomal ceramidase N-terminal domain-containing protein n=1 Tax=Singulisphaera sp. Ch08 TaxID=3120278 RepID=A0AAU7CE53_9BACT